MSLENRVIREVAQRVGRVVFRTIGPVVGAAAGISGADLLPASIVASRLPDHFHSASLGFLPSWEAGIAYADYSCTGRFIATAHRWNDRNGNNQVDAGEDEGKISKLVNFRVTASGNPTPVEISLPGGDTYTQETLITGQCADNGALGISVEATAERGGSARNGGTLIDYAKSRRSYDITAWIPETPVSSTATAVPPRVSERTSTPVPPTPIVRVVTATAEPTARVVTATPEPTAKVVTATPSRVISQPPVERPSDPWGGIIVGILLGGAAVTTLAALGYATREHWMGHGHQPPEEPEGPRPRPTPPPEPQPLNPRGVLVDTDDGPTLILPTTRVAVITPIDIHTQAGDINLDVEVTPRAQATGEVRPGAERPNNNPRVNDEDVIDGEFREVED